MNKRLQFPRTINSILQNKINKSIIFNYLRLNGPSYRARISKDLQISVPAVSRVIESLLKDGYIVETDKIRTDNGKFTSQYKVNSGKGIVLGIDLIKENIEVAISNLSGEIILQHQAFKFHDKIDVKNELIAAIEKIVKEYCTDNKVPRKALNLKGIGIGIPAVIDIDSGDIIDVPLYASLQGLNIKRDLERRFAVPVYTENIVRLSALAEKYSGEGKAYKDLVFFEVSTGIGAGIIIDNHLARGTYGSAGEIGFSLFRPDDLGFKYTNKGYFESIASVDSIVEKYIERIKSKRNGTRIDAQSVCTRAMQGDLIAQEVITEIVNYLSLSIIQLILILNPQLIVVGGDICKLPHVNELFIAPIVSNVERSIPFKMPIIKLSLLRENAGVIGAAFLAIESLLSGEFPYAIEYGSYTAP